MNRRLLFAAGAALLAFMVIAWTPLPADDFGSMHFDGVNYRVLRCSTIPWDENVFSAHTSYWGRQSKYFIKFTRGSEEIETLIIGFGPGLRLNVFDPPCSPLDEDDPHYGRFELVRSFQSGRIDSVNDWNSPPDAISPPVLVPAIGYTNRAFFSSTIRSQGKGWDDFVRIYNEVFESGYFGVIRFVPLDGAGFLIDDRIVTAHLAYSTDTDTETDFLDVGDPRIVYLSPEERPTFQGTVIGGICCRLPGTGQRARFSLYLPSSQFLCTKEITVPWASEAELRTLVYIGITPGFTDGHPTASIVGNERQEGEPTQCRIDSLWARPQP